MLDTKFFSRDGFTTLSSNQTLLSQFESYLAALPSANHSSIASLETRLVWSLLCMCRRRLPGTSIADFVNGAPSEYIDGDEMASKRLEVAETLITGQSLATNPLANSPPLPTADSAAATPLARQLKARESDFWAGVAAFVSVKLGDDDTLAQMHATLTRTRKLLDNLEMRDVLYSAMFMRYLGEVWQGRPTDDGPEAAQAMKDWSTAKRFLVSEAAGRAGGVVATRICGMLLGAFEG